MDIKLINDGGTYRVYVVENGGTYLFTMELFAGGGALIDAEDVLINVYIEGDDDGKVDIGYSKVKKLLAYLAEQLPNMVTLGGERSTGAGAGRRDGKIKVR